MSTTTTVPVSNTSDRKRKVETLYELSDRKRKVETLYEFFDCKSEVLSGLDGEDRIKRARPAPKRRNSTGSLGTVVGEPTPVKLQTLDDLAVDRKRPRPESIYDVVSGCKRTKPVPSAEMEFDSSVLTMELESFSIGCGACHTLARDSI